MEGEKNVFVEHIPEHYHCGNIQIVIHVKPSLKYVADDLVEKFEREIEPYND